MQLGSSKQTKEGTKNGQPGSRMLGFISRWQIPPTTMTLGAGGVVPMSGARNHPGWLIRTLVQATTQDRMAFMRQGTTTGSRGLVSAQINKHRVPWSLLTWTERISAASRRLSNCKT
jgi:hypothetical protein